MTPLSPHSNLSEPSGGAVMTVQQPIAEKNLDGYGFPPIEWDRVRAALDRIAAISPLEPSTRYWLATVRIDGRPHVMPVGILWHEGAFWFSAGAGTQKAKNIARDPRCVVSISTIGMDIVAEGTAEKMTDEPTVQRIADAFGASAGGWQPTVRDGAFW